MPIVYSHNEVGGTPFCQGTLILFAFCVETLKREEARLPLVQKMQFTPQQMSGYKGYSAGVLIGNWSEDIQVQEDKMLAYQRRMQAGQHRDALQPVMLAPRQRDGFLRFGAPLMLRNVEVDGSLALDLSQRCRPKLNHGLLTCTSSTKPSLRSVWILRKANDSNLQFYEHEREGDIVHYGQHIRIVNEYLGTDGHYSVSSRPLTSDEQSPFSGRQQVTACLGGSADCVWVIDQSDGKALVHPLDGNAIPVDARVVIRHLVTGKPLLSEAQHRAPTSAGPEPEVAAHLAKTQSTRVTAATLPSNFWTFALAPEGAPFSPFNPSSAQTIFEKIKARILQRGGGQGFRGLVKTLQVMDDDGSRSLSRPEFKQGMETFGVPLSTEELDVAFKAFDTNGDGSISISEFLRALRGAMNKRRLDLVREAFRKIDLDGSGVVTFGELCTIYGKNLSDHPLIKSGERTPEEVLREFISGWDKNHDGRVSIDEFVAYYNDVSVGIDDDDFFELMIRNAWHISGGEGVCENTANRRVLVIHSDGKESVEEIKNDLGIGPNDTDRMREELTKQGVSDIKEIKLCA